MRRWRSSSPDRTWLLIRGALILAGAGLGMAGQHAAFDWDDPRRWLPDLAVGLTFVVAGTIVVRRRPGSGSLLAATGFAWFAGNFDGGLVYLHRGPLVHLIVVYVGWRAKGRLELVAVVVGYLAALLPGWWDEPWVATATVLALVTLVVRSMLRSTGRRRADRAASSLAATLFASAVIGFAAVTRAVPSGAAEQPMLLVYHLALAAIAVLLARRLAAPTSASVADLVVELGESRTTTLRDALAEVLGDPALDLGYLADDGSYRDEHGNTLALPPDGTSRAATFVEWQSHPFAVLLHDPSVLEEPSVVEAAVTATRLSVVNEALTTEIGAHLEAVEASRRRLLVTADDERLRLEQRLHGSVEQPLATLAEQLARVTPGSDGDVATHLDGAVRHLQRTLADLRQLARGLHPRDLDAGLPGALESLVERSPVSLSVLVDEQGSIPDELAVATYFVCSEAVANVVKHANATTASIEVRCGGGTLVVVVADDGGGGADPERGSGLRGLADRVEALGGQLSVTSEPGRGTRLVAELPLGHQPARP